MQNCWAKTTFLSQTGMFSVFFIQFQLAGSQIKLNEEKWNHASLAQENGFGRAHLHTLAKAGNSLFFYWRNIDYIYVLSGFFPFLDWKWPWFHNNCKLHLHRRAVYHKRLLSLRVLSIVDLSYILPTFCIGLNNFMRDILHCSGLKVYERAAIEQSATTSFFHFSGF